MRNLKKILALVLALMMVLSVMVFASAANYDDYSDKDQVSPEYAEAVEVLTGMDIFWGSENSFYPKENVSRAEVATLLYRIMTTDVSGSQVGIYKDYGMFDDVLETNWFAGYVNYAANGELVVGVGDNKYNPKGNVTGYEWITMLLRAIGYDANGEISGSTWKITAASQAKQAGILGSFNEATLNSALTREQVAYLLFNAIQARKVNYTNAFGYRPSSLGYTIAWDMFRLACDLDTQNVWGQPSVTWYQETSRTATDVEDASYDRLDADYAVIEYEADATYYTAVTECDVADDVGFSRTASFTTYTNGVGNDNTVTLSAAETRDTIGAQGRQTYVYMNVGSNGDDVIVYIDTYLAQVTSVTDTRTDTAGHPTRDALLGLYVYNNGTTNTIGTNGQTVYVYDDTDYDYTVGQMLLVSVVNDSAAVYADVATTEDEVLGYSSRYEIADTLVIVDVADSFVGAQSDLWYNTAKHTIDEQDYDDAYRFYLDQAGNDQVVNHTWYLDQYDNLIGVTDIVSTNYAVLKDIVWVNGNPGHAEATLVDMNGEEYTATVNTIDGGTNDAPKGNNDFNGWTDSDQVEPDDSDDVGGIGFTITNARTDKAGVSDEGGNNTGYRGYALYRVDTRLDGTVDLVGEVDGVDIVDYAESDRNTQYDVTNNASAILDDDDDVLVYVNDNTVFLVRDAVDNSYDSYAGTSEVPTLEDVTIFYVDANGDNTAEYVYIKKGSDPSLAGNHVVYVADDNYTKPTTASLWTMTNVLVDGEPGTVTVDDVAFARALAAGEGKTFVVTYNNNGIVSTAPELVTSAGEAGLSVPVGYSVIYLGDDVTVSGNNLTSEYDRDQYHMDADTEALGMDVALTTSELEDHGVWVVYTGTTYKTVSHVYVGTALSETAEANIYLNGSGTPLTGYTQGGTAIALTYTTSISGPSADAANLAATALHNGKITSDWRANGTYGDATTAAFVVTSESGSHTARYEITRVADDPKATSLTAGWTIRFNNSLVDEPTCYQPTGTGTASDALKAALDHAKTLSLSAIREDGDNSFTIKLGNDNGAGYYDVEVYTGYADAAASTLTAGTTAGSAEDWTGTLDAGYYIVLGGGNSRAECTYYEAFYITD